MKEILQKYGLNEYDEYMLLKRSGARLPIDSLEFIDPILDTDGSVTRIFLWQECVITLDVSGMHVRTL